MNNEHLNQIKKEIENFFNSASFDIEDIRIELKEEIYKISLQTKEPKILIGEKGQTLTEIQHLIRIIIRKNIGNAFLIELDINDYKERKKEALQEIIKDIADEVVSQKKEKILPPMNSYERRIVHVTLQNRNDVKTESLGEGEQRRVVIKPNEN